ncbi:MAG: ArsR/SmtB family transcription factor [Candidatus Asgardarchaeia archaeon]
MTDDMRALTFKAKVFRALAEPKRLCILELLREKEYCACEFIDLIKISQSNTSRHLKILRDAGIVSYRQEGNKRIYYVTDKRIFRIIDSLDSELVASLSKEIANRTGIQI